MKSSAYKLLPSFAQLSFVRMGMAALVLVLMLSWYGHTHSSQYLIFAFLAALFTALQIAVVRLTKTGQHIPRANGSIVATLLLCILVVPVFSHNTLIICMLFLAAIPLDVAVAGQLKQLPAVLFLIFVVSAATILMDMVLPTAPWRIMIQGRYLWSLVGAGCFYLFCLVIITFRHDGNKEKQRHQKINVATQYALVFTGISAMVIILVTGVMIHQIRNAQSNQVGKSFQTIAENFAKLMGSHLEQQTQKLQMLTEQVPLFKAALAGANAQYDDRNSAKELLAQKNRLWQNPQKDSAFIMGYRNNSIIEALSRFRGHNSFHSDLVLVDGYGGLVASLGQMPKHFYFYDQKWWQISYNGGLGNIFIGDLRMDKRTMVPKLRIAVDIIDHSTNDVIGMLYSTYLLRTLLEDIQRFKPDTVDQISLTDALGRVIASTRADLAGKQVWSQLNQLTDPQASIGSGWALGRDHLDQASLIGYATLSTAYNVISDPLQRLGWHVVVSGTRSSALSGVTQSTKLAMLVGLLAMALGVLGAIAAARVITRPIENLTATASAMSEGNLDNRAQLTGPEELVALSAGFNQLTDQLHRVIRNLKSQTEQLAKAKLTAETATQLKGEFLANMSHEIRTPLNAILGFADILESSIEDAKQKRHAQTIKESGADLLHLINDILDLSKIEAGRLEMQVGPTNLRVTFNELQRIFAISAEEKQIQIEMAVAAELPNHLMLDRVRLRQVLFNLIGNAVKFTDQGYVRCTAKGKPADGGKAWNLIIEVRDTGIGIDPKAQSDIFETFKQHHGDIHPTHEGAGLGLAISKSLVEMMGGRIDVKGQPGEGATFSIHIPDVSASNDVTTPVAEIADAHVDKKIMFEPAAILIADDLVVNRHLIVEALKPYPFRIDQAAHGKAAVTMALKKRFDLILMDIRMPGMDGYGALKKIRRHLQGDAPAVIATTAAGMKEDIFKIKAAAFDDYLIRPFDQQALIKLLQCYLPYGYIATEPAPPKKEAPVLTFASLAAEVPWACPPEAEAYLSNKLRHQWEQVSNKQSIPDIIAFAKDVRTAGNRYHIDLLSRYGKELEEFAEGFDIHNVEKLLEIYDAILNCRVKEVGKEA